MSRWNIIIASGDGQLRHGEAIRERLSNVIDRPSTPNFELATFTELETAELSAIDFVLFTSGPVVEHRRLLHVLAMLEETGVPMIALMEAAPEVSDPFEFAGALILDHALDVGAIWSTMLGMLHRQGEVKQLRREVSVAQRFQGGLKGEIAKMHEELQLAAMVQREYLPREIPSLHGVELSVLWRPTNYVSGDIYDVVALSEDHLGVFIADAVGHGVPAALMTMVICRSLTMRDTTGGSARILEPSEVLGRLNAEMIRRQGRTTRFATAAYMLVDCRRRTIRVAGAGHPPPFLIRPDHSVEPLETSGGLLGVFDDEEYQQLHRTLDPDDRLLLYSDGFEQAFPEQTEDDYQRRLPTLRYRDEFAQLSHKSTPQEVIDTLGRRINDQTGSLHQVDDLTLICMQAGERPTAAQSVVPHETVAQPR